MSVKRVSTIPERLRATTFEDGPQRSRTKIGDLVWAKAEGYEFWPAKLISPSRYEKPENIKSSAKRCVVFFGKNMYAFVDSKSVKPFEEFKEEYSSMGSCKAFKAAIIAATAYEKGDGVNPEENRKLKLQVPKILTFDSKVKKFEIPSVRKRKHQAESSNNVLQLFIKTEPGSDKETHELNLPKTNASAQPSLKKIKTEPLDSPDKKPTSKGNVQSFKQEKFIGLPVKKLRKRTRFGNPSKIRELNKKIEATINEESQSHQFDELVDNSDEDDIEVVGVGPGTSRGRYNPKEACQKVYGFIGVGSMGSKLILRLLKLKLQVVIWNRTPSKCDELVKAGAILVEFPGDVIHSADITFSCLSSAAAFQTTYYHGNGALQAIGEGKGYVELTGIDLETSRDLAEGIESHGGRYLELQMHGTIQETENGQLLFLASNSRSLFNDCKVALRTMGVYAIFLGSLGCAIKVNLLLQGTRAVMGCCVAELMALAKQDKLCQATFGELLEITSMNSPFVQETIDTINHGFETRHSTRNTLKDLRHLLNWSDSLSQPLPFAASAAQILIQAIAMGRRADKDDAAAFLISQ